MTTRTTALLAAIGGALALAGPAQAHSCRTSSNGELKLVVFSDEKVTLKAVGDHPRRRWQAGSRACDPPRSKMEKITILAGGAGAQTVTLDLASALRDRADVEVRLSGGDDRLVLAGTTADDRVVVAPDGKDTVQVTSGPVRLRMRITGALGALGVDGGAGDDVLDASRSARPAALGGSAGNDRLIGGAAADQLNGGPGADQLTGSPGSDHEAGGDGDDVLTSAPSGEVDQLDGGAGLDLLTYAGHALGVKLVLTTSLPATPKPTQDREDHVAAVETVIGSDKADVLIGGVLGERLIGGLGDDLLKGMEGDDVLEGGKGIDRLDGGTGRNTCVGVEPGEQTTTCTVRP